jgi:hypothetical protein
MLGLALCALSAAPAQAQIPRMVSFQGVVADSTGTPLPDGAYAISFRLYSAASGGTALWEEQKTMQLRRGLVARRWVTRWRSIPLNSQPYWLGIQIGADPEMQPRVRLTSSGYSIRAAKSDTSLFALTAPTPAVVDSARIAGHFRATSFRRGNCRRRGNRAIVDGTYNVSLPRFQSSEPIRRTLRQADSHRVDSCRQRRFEHQLCWHGRAAV